MRIFLLTCLANIALAVASIWLLPNPVAVHFGADGAATAVLIAFLLIVTVKILLAFRLPKNTDQPV